MHNFISTITAISFLTVVVFAYLDGGHGTSVAEAGSLDSPIVSVETGPYNNIEKASDDEPCACERHNNKMTSLTCGVVLALLGGGIKNGLPVAEAPHYDWSHRFGSELYPDPQKKPPRISL